MFWLMRLRRLAVSGRLNKREGFEMIIVKEVGGKRIRMIKDSTGYPVPVSNVDKYDLLADREVNRVVKMFEDERTRLEQLMLRVVEIVKKLVIARGSGVADRGNMQFTSYNRLLRLKVVTDYTLELNDRAKVARQMMMAVATSGLEDVKNFASKQTLLAFIEDVFTPNTSGFIRSGMVWRLLKLKVVSKDWEEACQVLRSSMETHRNKSYLNVSTRESCQGEWVTIRLELSDCWPVGFDFNEFFEDQGCSDIEELDKQKQGG